MVFAAFVFLLRRYFMFRKARNTGQKLMIAGTGVVSLLSGWVAK